jgi:hypothetical protein
MKRVLACHDGSETATEGLLDYLRSQDQPAEVTIFHVMEPFPPSLLEHEGSEDPRGEEMLERRMEERRRAWAVEALSKSNRAFQPLLRKLRDLGQKGHLASLKIVPSYTPDDVLLFLKLEASSEPYEEVLIVHHSDSWVDQFLKRTTADRVRKELKSQNVRIVRCFDKTRRCEV